MNDLIDKIYSEDIFPYYQKDDPRIIAMLDLINSQNLNRGKILDIGCLDGTFLSWIDGPDCELYGIEPGEAGYQKALENGINVKKFFFDGNAELPFDSNCFDFIVAGEIIEHIYDTDFFLNEIRRILKDNGSLLLTTPNMASLAKRFLLLAGLNPHIENSPNELDSSGHIRYFTFDTCRALLVKNNFKVIREISDCMNFSRSGKFKSRFLSKLFPSLGRVLIFLCRKESSV